MPTYSSKGISVGYDYDYGQVSETTMSLYESIAKVTEELQAEPDNSSRAAQLKHLTSQWLMQF